MKPVTVKEVEFLAYNLAKEQMTWNEPIPDFGSRYQGRLESCLATAFQTYDKKQLYKTLSDKASITFYLMIKNHPFINGNKRIAITTLFTFLYLNEKWLNVSNKDLYEIAVLVASSDPKVKDVVVSTLKNFIKARIVNRKNKNTSPWVK